MKRNIIIAGHSQRLGIVGNDSSNLREYFELGWETVGSRFEIIRWLNSGLITSDDIVYTSEDRKFFYSSFITNVSSTDDFRIEIHAKDNVINIPLNFQKLRFLDAFTDFVNPHSFRYKYETSDSELIFNGFDLAESIAPPGNDFLVLGLRFRDHIPHKNSDLVFFSNLIRQFRTFSNGEVFTVGRGSEQFADSIGATYLPRLCDLVKLLKSDNCLGYITQSTGTALVALTSAVAPIFLIDENRVSDLLGENAVLGGRCVQFCKGPIFSFYDRSEQTAQEILSIISLRDNKKIAEYAERYTQANNSLSTLSHALEQLGCKHSAKSLSESLFGKEMQRSSPQLLELMYKTLLPEITVRGLAPMRHVIPARKPFSD